MHVGKGECKSCYVVNSNKISAAQEYKYLGDYIANGWETLYNKRCEKAQGYSATCQAMCTEMSLGHHIYSIAKLLHQSIFVNGSLVKMETWPNCTDTRIEAFERIEQTFFRKVLNAHSKTPIEALYLELGVVPLRFHLMKRRILYLQDIMNRDDGEITKQIILAQKEQCYKGDFYEQVRKNIEELSVTNEEMEGSKERLMEVVAKKIKEHAYEFLIRKARSHSKVNDNIYTNCEGASHYKNPRFTPDLANKLSKYRTRTFLVKNNFRNNYRNTNILCPVCEQHDDTQDHLIKCVKVREIYGKDITNKIEDIYSSNEDTLYNVAKILKDLEEIRHALINPE